MRGAAARDARCARQLQRGVHAGRRARAVLGGADERLLAASPPSPSTPILARRAAAEMSKYAAIDWAASADQGRPVSIGGALDWRMWCVAVHADARRVDLSPTTPASSTSAQRDHRGVELLDDPDLPALSPSSSSSPPPPVVADFTSCLSRATSTCQSTASSTARGQEPRPRRPTLALVRDDLLDGSRERPLCHSVLSYKTLSSSKPIGSIYATPPTYSIYMLSLVLDDLHARGGLRWAAERTARLAGLVYDAIDASGGFYTNPVEPASRSRISVPFGVTGGGGRPAESAELGAASSPRPPRPASVTSPATPSPAAPASPFTMACPSAPSRHSPTSCTPSAARTGEGGAAAPPAARAREQSESQREGGRSSAHE